MQDMTMQTARLTSQINASLAIDPVQSKAFLIGLQSGYNLAKSAQQSAEAEQDKKN